MGIEENVVAAAKALDDKNKPVLTNEEFIFLMQYEDDCSVIVNGETGIEIEDAERVHMATAVNEKLATIIAKLLSVAIAEASLRCGYCGKRDCEHD